MTLFAGSRWYSVIIHPTTTSALKLTDLGRLVGDLKTEKYCYEEVSSKASKQVLEESRAGLFERTIKKLQAVCPDVKVVFFDEYMEPNEIMEQLRIMDKAGELPDNLDLSNVYVRSEP